MPTYNRECRLILPVLPVWDEDDIKGEERRRIERHLIICPECRRTLASHREIRALVEGVGRDVTAAFPAGDSTSPGSLWPAIKRDIAERSAPRPRPALATWRRAANPASLLGAFAAAACLVLGSVSILSETPKKPLQRPAASAGGEPRAMTVAAPATSEATAVTPATVVIATPAQANPASRGRDHPRAKSKTLAEAGSPPASGLEVAPGAGAGAGAASRSAAVQDTH